MADHSSRTHDRSGDLWAARSLARLRWVAAISSFIMLGVLAWAPMKELLQPWRGTQEQYNTLATTYGLSRRPIGIHQIWIPTAGKADRCGTCHLGMVGEQALEQFPPFESHPTIPHPAESFGCTYCHSGQGWATRAPDAHGMAGTWAHPIFGSQRTEAGCGTCHSGLVLPLPEEVEDAPDLVEEYGCLKCHAAKGGTRGEAQSLTGIGLRGVPADWVRKHQGLIPPDDETSDVLTATEDELEVLARWLGTLVGAPHLARGKMVFQQLGCLGCHRRGDIGGDVGPELTHLGEKDAREIGAGETDSNTLPDWTIEHLRAPQELNAQSRMPPVDVEELEAENDLDDVVTYLLSLREDRIPTELTPPDRAKVAFGLGRDFPSTGRGLYVTFCSACHGFYATGKELETLGLVTPMIGTRGYLATVTPRYLRSSILRGRRGRYMPAWGPEDGGLSVQEIERIVDYLMSRGFTIKPLADLGGKGSASHGREVFAKRCAACHVTDRDGGSSVRFGRDLLAPGALDHFSDEILYAAITWGWVEEGMPSFAFLKPADVLDLMAFLEPAGTSSGTLSHDGRHSHFGKQVWEAKCVECHGRRGQGGTDGPMLNTEQYLTWASDGYLEGRTRDHRGGKARAATGTVSDDDLEAILDYIRGWSGHAEPTAPPPPEPDAVARGRELYSPRCIECHAEGGRGKTGPALANRDFQELVSRQFLVMTILEGRKGTAMQAWGQRSELPVSLQDAFDLADYISSLAQPSKGQAETSPDDENSSNKGDRSMKEAGP